jgi:hypothetical protein
MLDNDKETKWSREIIVILIALVALIVAVLAWLAPFNPIGPSPLLPKETRKTSSYNIVVEGNVEWRDTGIQLEAGQSIEVQYLSGSWSNCPANGCPYVDASGVLVSDPNSSDNLLLNCNHAALLAKIGDATYCVGNNLTIRITQSGTLLLRINDKVLEDNDGSVTVEIRVE